MNNTAKYFNEMVTLEQKYIKLQDQKGNAQLEGNADVYTELNGQCLEIREQILALHKKLGIK